MSWKQNDERIEYWMDHLEDHFEDMDAPEVRLHQVCQCGFFCPVCRARLKLSKQLLEQEQFNDDDFRRFVDEL